MIVKDEARVIKRCIDSVRPIITSWSIVDTGSTDGTMRIILDELEELPGELHQRPWKDYAFNKTEAIELARGKADYDLFLDADDVLVLPEKYVLPRLTHDEYLLEVNLDGQVQTRPHIFKNNFGYHYVGVRHEYLHNTQPTSKDFLRYVRYRCLDGGIRSRTPDVYRDDALAIEAELAKNRGHKRYVYYAAQSWLMAGEYKKAIKYYKKRVTLGGYAQEVFMSWMRLGQCYMLMKKPYADIENAFEKAAEIVPNRRAEAYYELAKCSRAARKYDIAYQYANVVLNMPIPNGMLVNENVYNWQIYDELAINAYYLEKFEHALDVFSQLLNHGGIYEGDVPRLEHNVKRCIEGVTTGEMHRDVK